MKRGRWVAVCVTTLVVAIAVGLLHLVLVVGGDSPALRYSPIVALGLLALVPFAAAPLSEHPAPYAGGAGGLALGIAATVTAAAMHQGRSDVMPLAIGVAIGGVVALAAPNRLALWFRLGATALLGVYAAVAQNLITVLFAYPLLGFTDEAAELIAVRRSRDRSSNDAVTTSRS